MKTTPTPRLDRELDAATPQWPVVLASLADPPTVTVSGITTPITCGDPQREVVHLAATQARGNGRPIRARVTTPGGEVHRLIITPTGRVVRLDPTPTSGTGGTQARPVSLTKKTKPHGRLGKSANRIRGRVLPTVNRFPRPVRWAGLAMGVLTPAALVVLVVHDRAPATAAVGPAPAPGAGRLYTQLGPPGWSQQAGWVLPIADDTIPATDPGTGVTAAVTGEDRSSTQTAGQRVGRKDRWLSVLEPDGRTRWATPLDDGSPKFGPVITQVDGAPVALIATGKQIRYWPLTGGPGTDLDLPSGAKLTATVGGSVRLTLPADQVGYLHDGAPHTVQTLPRTQPAAAVDGAVLVIQPDTGAWWTLTDDTAPTSVTPKTPPGAGRVQAVLAVTATRVLITWTPAPADPAGSNPKTPTTLIVAGYDRATGGLIASTTTPASALAGAAGKAAPVVVGNDPVGLTAAGPVILSTPPDGPASLTVVPGFTATSAADHVYGTLDGALAVVGADGVPHPLPDGTLTPTGGAGGEFLPVLSQGRLYALLPSDRP